MQSLTACLQLSILAVVVCAVANRVLYKMALVPLGNYVFFLAQLQTFGYVAVYFGILYWRYRFCHYLLMHLAVVDCSSA